MQGFSCVGSECVRLLLTRLVDAVSLFEGSACFRDVRRLGSLLTLNYFEFDLIALSERLETRSTDRAEMDKDVRTTFA